MSDHHRPQAENEARCKEGFESAVARASSCDLRGTLSDYEWAGHMAVNLLIRHGSQKRLDDIERLFKEVVVEALIENCRCEDRSNLSEG